MPYERGYFIGAHRLFQHQRSDRAVSSLCLPQRSLAGAQHCSIETVGGCHPKEMPPLSDVQPILPSGLL
jgi:hypothetical protein